MLSFFMDEKPVKETSLEKILDDSVKDNKELLKKLAKL